MFLLINLMKRAWWFTLSNALLKSIAHELAVPSFSETLNDITDSVYSMITTYPFLKPIWLLFVWRNSAVNFSFKLYSNNFEIIAIRQLGVLYIVLVCIVIVWGILCLRREGSGVAVQSIAMRRHLLLLYCVRRPTVFSRFLVCQSYKPKERNKVNTHTTLINIIKVEYSSCTNQIAHICQVLKRRTVKPTKLQFLQPVQE